MFASALNTLLFNIFPAGFYLLKVNETNETLDQGVKVVQS